jgi:CheY-like chemotaxis protein/nitrogen-specific signal transduction histidine kinase
MAEKPEDDSTLLRSTALQTARSVMILRRRADEHTRQAQKAEAIGQLTAGIAHDFNNLLAIVIGNLELAREQPGIGCEATGLLDNALHAARRGAEMNHHLLAFSRQQPLKPTIIDVNGLIAYVAKLLSSLVAERIRLVIAPAPDAWPVLIDPSQLEAALVNLTLNARDAIDGDGRIAILAANVSVDGGDGAPIKPGDYVVVSVADSGCGMSPEILARACDPYYTTKGIGKGTGLGLSMVDGFAEQSGGHLMIESVVGFGTTVKLYLPRSVGGVAQLASPPQAVGGGGETILVVDDNEAVRQVSARQIEKLGYAVIEAASAAQGLAALRDNAQIQLLFTDIVLPGDMDGYDLADEAIRLNPRIKVLFTSGYARSPGRRDIGVNAGILMKPYIREKLAKKLRETLCS